MRTSTNIGLTVWDLEADQFSHTTQAANLDLIDSYFVGFNTTTKLAKRLHTTATIPGAATAGDTVMLTAAAGGFPAWTLIRYDGSAWRPVSHMEIQPTVPATGNFAGRVVILSAADSGFDAWSIIRYDGSAWALVGGWATVNTGGGATNIQGLQQTKDTYISNSARGLVQVDRTTGTKYRLYIDGGVLQTEVVT